MNGRSSASIALAGILALCAGGRASAAWLQGYRHRTPLAVSNGGAPVSGYQVLITFDTAAEIAAGRMRADGADLRIADSDGNTALPHWVESGMNTAATRIWAKVPSLPAGSKILYLYSGNPAATSASDPDAVFPFFDDFAGGALDTSRWVTVTPVLGIEAATESTASYGVDGGQLWIDHASDDVNQNCDTTNADFNGWTFTSRSLSLPADAKLRIEAKGSFANVDWERGFGELLALQYGADGGGRYGVGLRYEGDFGAYVFLKGGPNSPNRILDVPELPDGGQEFAVTVDSSSYEVAASGAFAFSYADAGTPPASGEIQLLTNAGSCDWTSTSAQAIRYSASYDRVLARSYVNPEPATGSGGPRESDTTGPSVSASLSGPDAGGWYNGPVTVTLTCSDARSGCATISYCTDSTDTCAPTSSYGAPFSVSTAGRQRVRYAAVDVAGNAGAVGSTPVDIDLSGPAAGAVIDGAGGTDLDVQLPTDTLAASWSGFDDGAGSGIASYEWAIGTTAGGSEVQAWTNAGTATSATRTGLALTRGTTYYVSVRARDLAGHLGPAATSDGIQILGGACAGPDDCGNGLCVDGVCCESTCGEVCAACSIAAGGSADGACGPVTGTVCRAAAAPCDREEQCDGTSLTCPPDAFAPDLQACGPGRVCAGGLCIEPPRITSTPLTAARCGEPYRYSDQGPPTAAGTAPLTWALDPGAPDGASVDPSSGEVSWTPSRHQAGAQTLVLVARNGAGEARQTIDLEVQCDLKAVKVGCSCSAPASSGLIGAALFSAALWRARRRRR